MKKVLTLILSLIFISTLVYSQTEVKVTIRANTATVPDILTPDSYVQLRGETDAFGEWGSSGPILTNVGGDYWETTLTLIPGTTYQYKFFTNATDVNGGGWENNSTDPSNNRILVVPTEDVVLPLQFVNGTTTVLDQYYTPLVAGVDEVAVLFRVNMQGNLEFDKETQFVGVRGSLPASEEWSKNFLLTREEKHGNAGQCDYDGTNFWSGVTTIPKSLIGTTIEYKFVVLNSASEDADVESWEDAPNRTFVVEDDITLHWKWWADKEPPAPGVEPVEVKLTIIANTATVPDTLKPDSYVQIRGGAAAFGNWSSSGPLLTNVGGDYWETTVTLTGLPGTTVPYKFFTHTLGVTGESENAGWEQDIDDPSNNRLFVFPDKDMDMVLPVQFVNGTPNKITQDYTPLVAGVDEVAIMFRVNMQGNENFNKETQFVAVRGGFPASDEWSRNFVLTQEQPHGNQGSRNYDATNFWSGVTTIPKSMAGNTIEYKFVVLNSASETADVASWESTANRTFVVEDEGKTLYWQWWENRPPVAFRGTDTVIVNYRTDLSAAIRSRGFTAGDTIFVSSGWANSAKSLRDESPSRKYLAKTGIVGNIYTATDTLVGAIGDPMYYQYYVIQDGTELREIFFNFDYTGSESSLGERRSVILQGTNNIVDTITSVTDSRRQPEFRNRQLLRQNVTVKLVCDLRPAYYTLLAGGVLESIQGGIADLTSSDADKLYEMGVWVNGPMTGGWTDWGGSLRDSLSKKMYDDGTNGDDVAGDGIFTTIINLGPGFGVDQRSVGQEFKFGIYGGDNESGFGLNHIENIDDGESTFTLYVQFGSINPNRYFGWDFDSQRPLIDINVDQPDVIPMIYSLSQNYPNPFNPSTIISYDIPQSSNVSLKVYDIMGREVATLVSEVQAAGRYEVVFGAKNISSGVYFYRLTADGFTAIKKMVLMK